MELVIQILMLFIIVNVIMKLSFWKWWQTLLFALISAVFVLVSCSYAILQSKTQLSDYMNNTAVMQDAAVLITIESVLCFAFCFAALRSADTNKEKVWQKALKWYPGLLLFPVLFYILTQTVFAMPGTDFTVISYILAGAVLVLLPLLSIGVRYMYPEKELRLEVYFLVSLFVCIIGLITTVNGNVTYAPAEEPVNIRAVVISLVLFLLLFLTGILWSRLKWKLISKKQIIK